MWYLELQQAITYSKMTLGTLEQGGNMYKVNNKGTGTTLVVLVSLLLTLNIFSFLL